MDSTVLPLGKTLGVEALHDLEVETEVDLAFPDAGSRHSSTPCQYMPIVVWETKILIDSEGLLYVVLRFVQCSICCWICSIHFKTPSNSTLCRTDCSITITIKVVLLIMGNLQKLCRRSFSCRLDKGPRASDKLIVGNPFLILSPKFAACKSMDISGGCA